MIYTASQTPEETVLIADAATWKALLALRPVPRGGSVSHQVKPGEAMSQAEWRDTAGAIERAIGDQGGAMVVRVRLRSGIAAAVVEMARWGRQKPRS